MTATHERDGRPRWGSLFAVWCLVVAAFQAALAAGAPWGAAAWGGRRRGVLPVRLRWASALAAAVVGLLAGVASGRLLGQTGRRRTLLAAAAYASLGVLANGVSPSLPERLIWTPMGALGAGLAAQAWREAGSRADDRPAGRRSS